MLSENELEDFEPIEKNDNARRELSQSEKYKMISSHKLLG